MKIYVPLEFPSEKTLFQFIETINKASKEVERIVGVDSTMPSEMFLACVLDNALRFWLQHRPSKAMEN